MRKIIFISFSLILIILIIVFYYLNSKQPLQNPLIQVPKPKPLLSYTFENLQNTKFQETQIILGAELNKTTDYTSQMFYYSVPSRPGSESLKKVSGVINLPNKPGTYPVIVQFRGYISKETYKSGIGTQPSAKVFASNGFITIAPDFLGYGESDPPSENGFEDRLQTYSTALTLLSSLPTFNAGLEASYSGKIKADTNKVGLWGHSNGGHIALSTLAISGVTYPTVLWAPVSKSFPYSILYYTDEFDDQGKSLRKFLAGFEENYDTEAFSPPNYYSWIKAPLQIHQGSQDQEVPVWWSDELVEKLKEKEIDVSYYTYLGSDHNLQPSGWNPAVTRSIDFYTKYFSKQK